MSDGEEVVSLCPHLQSLQPRKVHGHLVVQTERLQTKIATILNPAATEAAVAHAVVVANAGHVGNLSLKTPTISKCGGLVVEVAATLKDATLIVEDIVAQRVVEAEREGEVLPHDISEDITIDVGVRIANDGLILFTNLAIAIEVGIVGVAGMEVLASTCIVEDVQITTITCCVSFCII